MLTDVNLDLNSEDEASEAGMLEREICTREENPNSFRLSEPINEPSQNNWSFEMPESDEESAVMSSKKKPK